MIVFIDNDRYEEIDNEKKKLLEETYSYGGRTIDSVIGAFHGDTDTIDDDVVEIDNIRYLIVNTRTYYKTRTINNSTLEKIVQVFLVSMKVN